MKLLVTGGAGFIGSNFLHYWVKHHPEDDLINFDKLTYAGNLQNLKNLEDYPRYRFVRGDITDTASVNAAMDQVTVVVHFAAETHVDRSIIKPQVFISTNVLGTQVLLDAALEHKIKRFIHVSTDEVYGDLPLASPDSFTESSPYNPHSPYAASKAGADHLVRAYISTYRLPAIITNCSNNYGPYQFPEKFIPLAITNILESKPAPLYGAGSNIRDWLFVVDHCRALDLVIHRGVLGQTYCIGGLSKGQSNRDILRKICRFMKVDFNVFVKRVKDRPGHDRKYALNWSKINHDLGWRPDHDFDTQLQATISWYQENKTWWQPLKKKSQPYFQHQYGS